jgi:serine/threonine-protein kinase
LPAAEEVPARFSPTNRIGGSLSGDVWEAHDAQTGETVAYKLVSPQSLPTPAALERAQRELKQLLRAQSPRIARVLESGRAPDGRMFIATELCAGEPLSSLVERTGPLPLERAKKIIAQIGEALLEGQKVGVVHHDLAPKNVIVDREDQVKVINFTVPWPINDRVFGVPEFLSPEQAEGKPGDQRSNTYGLGAIAVFLLTGAPPFSGPSAQAVLDQVLRGAMPPPSQRRPELTPEIDRVILRAMDKSSSRRPLTLRQFLNEVASMHLAGAAAPAARVAPSLSKTIAYSGGAPEVRRLVAEATAARAEANGSGPVVAYSPVATAPAPAPRVEPAPGPALGAVRAVPDPASQPTPPPAAHRGHGAAVAATMVALPAAAPGSPGAPVQGRAPAPVARAPIDPYSQVTPPPAVHGRAVEAHAEARRPAAGPAATAQAPAAQAPASQGQAAGQGANFRETLWFKKGDVEQMVAEAKAKASAAPKGRAETPSSPEMPAEDGKPLEDRYLDDGSVTVDDRKKFSLRGGGTAAGVPAVGGAIPGERMSESEMLNEIGGGKRVTVIVIVAVAVAVAAVVLIFALKGKGSDKAAPAPAAAVVAKPADESAAPPSAAKTAEPPAPAVAAPGADREPARAKEAVTPAKDTPATAKARSAKKKVPKRTAGKRKR